MPASKMLSVAMSNTSIARSLQMNGSPGIVIGLMQFNARHQCHSTILRISLTGSEVWDRYLSRTSIDFRNALHNMFKRKAESSKQM